MDRLRSLVRDIPDFPRAGIMFRDIMPLLRDPVALAEAVERLASRYRDEGIGVVAGIESRGFLFGTPLAIALNAGFVAVRKLGKLPGDTVQREYALEYGTNHLEVQRGALIGGERVLLVDDVLATGGTARAAGELIEELGGEIVGAAFLLELTELRGRESMRKMDVFSLLAY
jgi:adenine phosphoribosyltransferase